MNVGEYVTAIVLFGIFLASGIIAMRPIYKHNKEMYNPINRAFIILLWFVIVLYTSRIALYLISGVLPNATTYVLGVGLKQSYLLTLIVQAAYLTFLFYLYGLKRLYTMPGVVVFFVIYYLVFNEVQNFLYITLVLLIVNFTLFIKKGIDNHNGTIFGYALYLIVTTVFGSVYAITSGDAELTQPYYLIGFTMGFLLLSLGTYGWFERHVLYDREKERQIKNGWAAQRIQVYKAPPMAKETSDKKVYVECPICHITNVEIFTHQKVQSRYNDPRGITLERISKASSCGHAIQIFVDRNFKVRATEPLDALEVATVIVAAQ